MRDETCRSAFPRAELLDSPVGNPYTLAHYTYHGWHRDLENRLQINDLFIVSDKGQIVYSVEKQADFGTNLIDGPYATTNMGRLFRQIMDQHRKGYVRTVDYDFYLPAGGAPMMSLGTPISMTVRPIGQLSDDEINRAMNGNRSWQADGFGRTGFADITGASLLLHDDHRIVVEHPDAFLGIVADQGYRPDEIDAIRYFREKGLLP